MSLAPLSLFPTVGSVKAMWRPGAPRAGLLSQRRSQAARPDLLVNGVSQRSGKNMIETFLFFKYFFDIWMSWIANLEISWSQKRESMTMVWTMDACPVPNRYINSHEYSNVSLDARMRWWLLVHLIIQTVNVEHVWTCRLVESSGLYIQGVLLGIQPVHLTGHPGNHICIINPAWWIRNHQDVI